MGGKGQFDDLVGELQPGQYGWLPLDEDGEPSGSATLLPPAEGPACHVLHATSGPDLLVSASGAPLETPLNSNVDKRLVVGPTINSLTPATAEVGAPDVVVVVDGANFYPDSVIVWNGSDEPTTYINDHQLSTVVKPSTASGPWTIPVEVRNGSRLSDSLYFQFTEPAGQRKK